MALVIVGISCITFGITRWAVTDMLVDRQLAVIGKYLAKRSTAPSVSPDARLVKETSQVGGPYKFGAEAILLGALGATMIACGAYLHMRCRGQPEMQ